MVLAIIISPLNHHVIPNSNNNYTYGDGPKPRHISGPLDRALLNQSTVCGFAQNALCSMALLGVVSSQQQLTVACRTPPPPIYLLKARKLPFVRVLSVLLPTQKWCTWYTQTHNTSSSSGSRNPRKQTQKLRPHKLPPQQQPHMLLPQAHRRRHYITCMTYMYHIYMCRIPQTIRINAHIHVPLLRSRSLACTSSSSSTYACKETRILFILNTYI